MWQLTNLLRKAQTRPAYNVMFYSIDLDRFKNVNDSLGHLFGNCSLIAISSRRRNVCGRTMVARLGGDEFGIWSRASMTRRKLTVAERVQDKFRVPFRIKEHDIYSSASIGILARRRKTRDRRGHDCDADTAMYQAKRRKARHEVFDDDMHRAKGNFTNGN